MALRLRFGGQIRGKCLHREPVACPASGLARRDFTGIFAPSRSGYQWPHQLEAMTMLTQTAIRNVPQRQPATQSRRAPVPGAAMQAGTIELMGACMPFAANAEIYGENEPADYLYKVVSGTVRTYKVLVDGRRQIGAFHLPGDIFGFETGDEHTFSAEAITDCKIIVIK